MRRLMDITLRDKVCKIQTLIDCGIKLQSLCWISYASMMKVVVISYNFYKAFTVKRLRIVESKILIQFPMT